MDAILQALKKADRAAFRTREYAALLNKPGYARLVLHRLKTKGELISIKNGWWTFPDALPDAMACEISKPCYLSFHSALSLHGLTTQMPRNIQLAVIRKTRKYKIFEMEVKEYKIKREQFNNFSRNEGMIVASQEKAFADCLLIPRACPEIVLLEAIDKVDLDKVKQLITPIAI
ncbi:MAG: hypothetical protein HZB67_01755, partial [Candidatus Aenigmarchaeota archaeon]|nr:hypothetical protein [Candidatus Aenigmarchaeota archaeon]